MKHGHELRMTDQEMSHPERPDTDGDQAVHIVLNKLERGMQPTEAELIAADLCVKCAGFGFVDYEDDGFTEIPCGHCKPTS